MPTELIILIAIVFVLYSLLSRSPIRKGNAGEAKVSAAIRKHLPKDEYFLIDDIVLRDDRGETQIDHILVSRFGVFVIETKNYSGWIFGSAKNRTWTQTFRTQRHKFQNPLRQNYRHVKAVQHHLRIPEKWIVSVVLFVGSAKFKTVVPENVTSIRGGLRYIRSFSSPIMSYSKAQQLQQSILSREPIESADARGRSAGMRLAHATEQPVELMEGPNSAGRSWHSGSGTRRSSWFALLAVPVVLAALAGLIGESGRVQQDSPKSTTTQLSVSQRPFAPRQTAAAERPIAAEQQAAKKGPPPPIPSFELSGRVAKVRSGDTIDIRVKGGSKQRIKLYGIDSPEYKQTYGRYAKKALSKLVYRKTVYIDVVDEDPEGIIHGVVYLNGRNINAEITCGGHAWWNQQQAPQDRALMACQQKAREASLGLWADPEPIPPWEYRAK